MDLLKPEYVTTKQNKIQQQQQKILGDIFLWLHI